MLWNDLPHPSPTQAGPTTRYRRHDGGGNNPHNPEMGKAGTPYARNVPPLKPKGKHGAIPVIWRWLIRQRTWIARCRRRVRGTAETKRTFPTTSIGSESPLLLICDNRHPRVLPDLEN